MLKILIISLLAIINGAVMAGPWTVTECGAVGDGKTDATAAFQKALDAAGQAGGGVVDVPTGEYRINGFLLIPGGVTLQGTYRTPPTNDHEARPRMDGSVLQAYSGRGKPEAAPFIRLNGSNAVLMGLIITGNQATAGLVVENQAGARTQVLANELSPVVWTKDAKLHYRVDVGAPGDRAFVRKWHAQEAGGEWTDRPGTKRWSGAESLLLLPVVKGRTYTLTLELFMPAYALSPDAGLYLGERRLATFPDQAGTAVITATLPAAKTEQSVVTVRCQGWCPKDLMPGNLDTRVLGVGVRSVTLRAKRAHRSVFDACRGTWQE